MIALHASTSVRCVWGLVKDLKGYPWRCYVEIPSMKGQRVMSNVWAEAADGGWGGNTYGIEMLLYNQAVKLRNAGNRKLVRRGVSTEMVQLRYFCDELVTGGW